MPLKLTEYKKLQEDESGFASLVIAIVLVLVLSLVTVGFAQLMQREQRQALDKQLSSQAYYAAETGINDAVTAINKDHYAGTKSTCAPISDPGNLYPSLDTNGQVGTNTGASYSCLLIDPSPSSLTYGNVDINQPTVVKFTASSNVHRIVFQWGASDGNNSSFATYTTCSTSKFVPGSSWTSTVGLLRVAVTPLYAGGYDRQSLINNTFTAFLCPGTPAGAPVGSDTANYPNNNVQVNSGPIITGNCSSGSHRCMAQIDGLNKVASGGGTTQYLVTLKSIYKNTSVSVYALGNDSSQPSDVSNPLSTTGAQIQIDSTGKAQDVLRRIQVRVPGYESFGLPGGTVGDICKELNINPDPTIGTNDSCPANY